MRDKVEKLVNQLSDPTERYVVRLRYLDLARWEDIATPYSEETAIIQALKAISR